MLYYAYELNHAALAPLREAAGFGKKLLESPFNPFAQTFGGRTVSAAFDLFESMTRRYGKPLWRLGETTVNGVPVGIKDRAIWQRPFCQLIHFERDKNALLQARGKVQADPRVLIIAPLSGHYATLLRRTVESFLPDHEVFVSDWTDAREVPVINGKFDLNDYIDYVIDMLHVVGPNAHVVGICQPGPPVLAAISLMAEVEDPDLPATMTFMGSPIDPRESPTVPNKIAMERSYDWFKDNAIYTVPFPNPGVMRRVYPGFLQLGGFISMNQERHVTAHKDYFNHLVEGDCDSVHKHREFYDEYLAVLDLTAEFYLQTIRDVFQEFKLPKHELMHRGRLVRPNAIKTVALMTVEGENDDISGIGQTQAAHDLCSSIPESMKIDYIQPGVGHYGVFSGTRYRTEIQPRMREFFLNYFNRDKETAFQLENPHLIHSV
jgi:poly(3-hydroxybutyrate) depolymerase